ncbi:hypothetical protein MPC1_11420003 [Methylocella tundrae]|nr:hypothetical protein MPC1_11420003 [Methylocella tundrae]
MHSLVANTIESIPCFLVVSKSSKVFSIETVVFLQRTKNLLDPLIMDIYASCCLAVKLRRV